jgi:citrate synthase
MQVVILNATGKLASKNMAEWFEAVQICMSWPDPRIWCNRIGALGATAGTETVGSVCAGLLAADSRSYGVRTLGESMDLIARVYSYTDQGGSVEDFVKEEVKASGGKPYLIGFARPVAKGDERISVLERLSKKLGFEHGPHLALAYQIESVLNRDFGEAMNISGYISAFASDHGYSSVDVRRIFSIGVSSGISASHVDYADREQGAFAPLQVCDINYLGQPKRSITD